MRGPARQDLYKLRRKNSAGPYIIGLKFEACRPTPRMNTKNACAREAKPSITTSYCCQDTYGKGDPEVKKVDPVVMKSESDLPSA